MAVQNTEAKKSRDFRMPITTAALCATYLAQLGGHQESHHLIANIAMSVESGTLLTLFLTQKVKQTSADFSRRLNYLTMVGFLIIAGCFAAVPATDERYAEYFNNGKNILNPGDWQDFVSQSLLPDFEQHVSSGILEVQNLLH